MTDEQSPLGLGVTERSVGLSSESTPSLSHIPEFMRLGARLVETEAGWNGVSEVWEVPYADDPKGRSFELYAMISGIPGPYVCYSAGSHGNEMISVSIAKRLGEELRQQIARGTLIIIPRANVPAVNQGRRIAQGQGEGDINRHYNEKLGSSLIGDRAHTVLEVIRHTYEYNRQTYKETPLVRSLLW